MSGILFGTKCYLAGQLEFGDLKEAMDWRDHFSNLVRPLGIRTFSPFHDVFLGAETESSETQSALKRQLQEGEFEKVHRRMKEIRGKDLRLVDISDFIVAVLDPKIPTFGLIDEIITSKKSNKPVFLVIRDGYSSCPLWLCSYFTHNWVYKGLNEVFEILKLIDSGAVPLDPKYWKILKRETSDLFTQLDIERT